MCRMVRDLLTFIADTRRGWSDRPPDAAAGWEPTGVRVDPDMHEYVYKRSA